MRRQPPGSDSARLAALQAAAAMPAPDPVPAVTYRSEGRLLIVGPAQPTLFWAGELAGTLDVTVLITSGGNAAVLPGDCGFRVVSGDALSVSGHLGRFEARWEQRNPIDLEICVRCNACVQSCPEQAVSALLQIDLHRCKGHRACVKACGATGAIDFARSEPERSATFDLVLDLGETPLFTMHQPPQGYFAPGGDPVAQLRAMRELLDAVGEFEKPRYFSYDASICAHGRSRIEGCRQCIDVCSTQAISEAGDGVSVDPYLCLGCGACATVCPSGAMTYAYPGPAYQGERLRTMLTAYREAGGETALVLAHDGAGGRALLDALGRLGRSLPSRVIPFEVHHPASVGLDLALTAVAYGASQFAVLFTGDEAPQYAQALRTQFGFGQRILEALGYGGGHLLVIEAADGGSLAGALQACAPAQAPGETASFRVFDRKRSTLAFVFDHLLACAPQPQETIELARGAPFGAIEVDREACTLCMACAGICPENALVDGRERPQLRFIEANCVQCGLCEKACPEDAIALKPRLRMGAAWKSERLLNEDRPFACVRCGKEFATTRLVENMVNRLVGHAMFTTPEALARVKMCGDCRVIDMMERGGEASIFDYRR
jgi:ferredoxin